MLHWMHTDCLSSDWLTQGPAVFVFDDAQIEEQRWGIKRLGFIYECLLELPVEIHHGATVETLASQASGGEIVTVASVDPWIQELTQRLQRRAKVTVLPAPVFVDLPGKVDLKRFSRYWQKAERLLT
jgi:hypothetical protein